VAIDNAKKQFCLVPRYTRRLFFSLVAGFLVHQLLVVINPNLGLFVFLMFLNIGIVALLGVIYAVQSIRHKESWRWLGYGYLLLVAGGIIWAIIDM